MEICVESEESFETDFYPESVTEWTFLGPGGDTTLRNHQWNPTLYTIFLSLHVYQGSALGSDLQWQKDANICA